MMQSSLKAPTKSERERWTYFPQIGCICCRMLGTFNLPEVHHLLSGNRRRGHAFTIPLCAPHHRGVGYRRDLHKASVALGSKPFHAAFGSDDALLAETDKRIEALRSQRV